MIFRIPAPFPLPPVPITIGRERGNHHEEEVVQDPGVEFLRKMRSEGFGDELIEMGIKVAGNHMRPPEEAYRIGENYIREMAK